MTRVRQTRHVLAVNDTGKTAEHFINALGFKCDFAVEGWQFLSLGDFLVMLGECPNEGPASETNNHSYFAHVLVEDVDDLYSRMKAQGASFYQEVEDKPWGMREFYVVTPDGHRMDFAQETG